MMTEIINYICPENEVTKILQLREMRFETLIEIVRDRFDPDLKTIDYYEQCHQPNTQHFFLAEMIKRGHFVMTTNFDHLIEQVLLQSNVSKDHIVPVITKEDFEQYQDPTQLFQEEKLAVFKIHGSPSNVITGEATKDSLIATIQAFGRNKEGLNIFQLESFKLPLFKNITNGRSLLVMGYSGSDDFDILPTLKTLKNLSKLIWVDHVSTASGTLKSHEVVGDIPSGTSELDRVDQILSEFKHLHPHIKVYRVTTNISQLLRDLLPHNTLPDSPAFSLTPLEWFTSHFGGYDGIDEYNIVYQIYYENGKLNDALRCAKKHLHLLERKNDKKRICFALQNVGAIYHAQNNFKMALRYYKLAIKFANDTHQLKYKGVILNNIGDAYLKRKNYPEALKWLEKALLLANQVAELKSHTYVFLNNIGRAHTEMGNLDLALKYLQEAIDLGDIYGSLSEKAKHYNNLGIAQEKKGELNIALEKFTFAYQIAIQLGEAMNQIHYLGNMARIYQKQKKYVEALDHHQQALEISTDLGDYEGIALRLNKMANVYVEQKNYPAALSKSEEIFVILKLHRLTNPHLEEVTQEYIRRLKIKLG